MIVNIHHFRVWNTVCMLILAKNRDLICLPSGSRYYTIPQSPLSLPIFLTHIGSQMPNKWRTFGILLDIPWSELETYPAHSCMDCFARVFDTWEGKGSPEFSWETVINVLENPLLEERCLAQKVREMMTTVTTIC